MDRGRIETRQDAVEVDDKGYKFLQVHGNCAAVWYLGNDRIRGPVDNVVTIEPHCLKSLMEGTYGELLKTEVPEIIPRSPSFVGDSKFGYRYKHVFVAHKDPRSEGYQTELARRMLIFKDFIEHTRVDDKYWLTYSINQDDIDQKTHKLKSNNLERSIKLLMEFGLLDKTVFVSCRNPKSHWNFWSDEATALLKKYNVKHLEIIDMYSQDYKNIAYSQFLSKFFALL